MRIACVQSNVVFGDPAANARNAVAKLEMLAEQSVQLAIFPEAYLTGYCVSSQADADAIAVPAGDDAIKTLREACDRLKMVAILGFAEAQDGVVYNSAVLLESGVAPRFYRKSHLPDLGLDKFVQPGNEIAVFDTHLGRIGILICFDLRAPEATRSLALQGAELVALPTNWPEGAEVSADFITVARAAESRIFVATCNRVGEENGFRFIGRSKIVHPTGRVLAAAGADEDVLVADLHLPDAREKRTVAIPGKYETDVFSSRRPELYGRLVETAG